MLWVRVPPEPLETRTPLWSSPECSPPCHGGDRRFKSDRGRFCSAVRKLAKRRSSNLRVLRVRLPPELLTCVGWALASLSGCNPPAFGLCRFNSCPAHFRYGPFVYRHRMPDPRSGEAGSTPARAAEPPDQVAQLADARRSERRALRAWEFDSPLGHSKFDAGAAGAQLALIRPVSTVRFRGLQL